MVEKLIKRIEEQYYKVFGVTLEQINKGCDKENKLRVDGESLSG